MSKLQFNSSQDLSLGVEIELQLIDPNSGNLTPKITPLLANLSKTKLHSEVKPEVTCSMLEIASDIHQSVDSLAKELQDTNQILTNEAKKIHIQLSGGGTHPFQAWKERKINPDYKLIYDKYDFLIKKFTVFGIHIHLGCDHPDKAISLIHRLAQYIPHFIALSASSPFYDGAETNFHSTRLHLVDAFPLSGHFPFVKNWIEFQAYFSHFEKLHIVEHIRNFYWDLRLRPEFGTIELRVCDTPLTLKKTLTLIACIQTIALYLLEEKPIFDKNLYLPYAYNRFQACRYGLDGLIATPSSTVTSIKNNLLQLIPNLQPYAKYLGNEYYLDLLMEEIQNGQNDALLSKTIYAETQNLKQLSLYHSQLWMSCSFSPPKEA